MQAKLEKENDELRKKNDWLTTALKKFSCGSLAFNMMLASQKCIFDKKGIGYKGTKNEKYYKNYFVKEGASKGLSTTCNFCGRKGHISNTCPLKFGNKKNNPKPKRKINKIWGKDKEKGTNIEGPKMIWVPKVT